MTVLTLEGNRNIAGRKNCVLAGLSDFSCSITIGESNSLKQKQNVAPAPAELEEPIVDGKVDDENNSSGNVSQETGEPTQQEEQSRSEQKNPTFRRHWNSGDSVKALIVDTNSFSAFTTKQLLNSLPGYPDLETAHVETVNAAIRELHQTEYNLIVTEFELNDGKNATHLIKLMKEERFFEPSIVVLLSEQTRQNIISVVNAQPDELLLKPYQISVFNQRVSKSLQKQRDTSSVRRKLVIKDYDGAFSEINDILNSGKRSFAYFWCMRQKLEILRQQQHFGRIIDYTEFLMSEVDVEWIRTSRIEALVKKNMHDVAMDEITACLKKYPLSVNSLVLKGDLLHAQNNSAQAADCFKQALKICPEIDSALEGLSRSASNTNRYEDALFAVKRLIKKISQQADNEDDNHVNHYHLIASLLVRQAENSEDTTVTSAISHGVRYLAEASARFPFAGFVTTHKALLEAYNDVENGNLEKAQETLSNINNLQSTVMQKMVFVDAVVILRLANQSKQANELVQNWLTTGGNLVTLERIDNRTKKLMRKPSVEGQEHEADILIELAYELVEKEQEEKATDILKYGLDKNPEYSAINLAWLEVSLIFMKKYKLLNDMALQSKKSFETLKRNKDFNTKTDEFTSLEREFKLVISRREKQNQSE